MINPQNINLSETEIADFCKRWCIRELALFGSVLREDFGPDSDIDVLISFAPEADWGLFDHLRMEEELSHLFNRNVDLLTRRAVEHNHNAPRRQEILGTAQTIYVTR
jgi:uncharacterized protein